MSARILLKPAVLLQSRSQLSNGFVCGLPKALKHTSVSTTYRSFASESRTSPLPSSEQGTRPDVLIVGSGAAGLAAALRARSHGLSPLLVEKHSKIGGTSAYSGGGVWIPNSHLHGPEVKDSPDEALTYMEALIGDAGPASSRERKVAFLDNGPKMVKWLEDEGFKWIASTGYPDYFPDLPGGKANGRSIEGALFDVKKLGVWREKLVRSPHVPSALPMHTFEGTQIYHAGASLYGFRALLRVLFGRVLPQRLLGRDPALCGRTLTAQLLHLNLQRGNPIWLNSRMKELIVTDGKVSGAVIEKGGQSIMVEAPHGVLLAAGGFAHNAQMRQAHQQAPISADWTAVQPGDTGDAISAAVNVGATTALMDDAW